jgi:tight adherence protein B
MSLLLGALLGVGLLLVVAPMLRPRRVVARSRRRGGGRIVDRLARAGAPRISPAVFVAVSALLGVAAGAVTAAMTGLPVLGLLAGGLGAVAPWSVAGWRARARAKALRSLWPEVVDHLLASVRAGQPLPDAIADLRFGGPAPFRPGFDLFFRRWQQTGTVGPALDALKEHFADATADRLVEILRMAREVGGTELPVVLRDLAGGLRQDLALRGEAEARQSWVTNAGKLGIAAPWVVLGMLTTREEAARAYNSPMGVVVILGALALTAVAYRVMLAIGRLPEEQRWFR